MCNFFRNLFTRCFNWCGSKCRRGDVEHGGIQGIAVDELEMGPIKYRSNADEESGLGDDEVSFTPSKVRFQLQAEYCEDREIIRLPSGNVVIQDCEPKDKIAGRARKALVRQPARKQFLLPPRQPWEDMNK